MKTAYYLDLADDGCWLIKSRAGYRERIGAGNVAKKRALEEIGRLNEAVRGASFRRFIVSLLAAALIFIAGVVVGRFVLSPSAEIVVIDVEKLAVLIEKYNMMADEIRAEFEAMKEWNENALIEPPEVQPEEEEKEK